MSATEVENKPQNMAMWSLLPDDLLLQVFEFLSCKELGRAGQVCYRWKCITDMEYLWKKRFIADYQLKRDATLMPGTISWRAEYERLSDRVPCVELDKIEEHTDEVLHVSFSHNGMMFCTCSKDACVKVFNADWPFDTIFSAHLSGPLSVIQWTYTQLSQFSPCDTQLLVSGRSAGAEQGGEIVIYNIFAGTFTLQARVRIVPYDVMGTWLSDTHILSAKAHVMSSLRCLCEVILNKSDQEVEDLYQSTVKRMFLFRCDRATVSYLLVSDLSKTLGQVIRRHSDDDLNSILHPMHTKHLKSRVDINKLTNMKRPNTVCLQPLFGLGHQLRDTHEELVCCACTEKTPSVQRTDKRPRFSPTRTLKVAPSSCFSFCSKMKDADNDLEPHAAVQEPNTLLKSCGINTTDSDSLHEAGEGFPITAPPLIRERIGDEVHRSRMANVCEQCGKPFIAPEPHQATNGFAQSEIDSSSATSADEDLTRLTVPASYKLLVCFTGHLVCMPHQIGIKVIQQEECSKVADTDMKTILAMHDYARPKVRADTWDHILEMEGHCVGMTLSPCNRYLYVNIREWINDEPFDDFGRPPISNEIKMLVFDLVTMKQVTTMLGHSATSDVFFLHLSTNELYVASGSEDSRGYIWDRHYNTCVASLPHDSVVNCVAVNPRDPSMAVTASDDNTVKIWRSRGFHRLLSAARAKARTKARSSSHCT